LLATCLCRCWRADFAAIDTLSLNFALAARTDLARRVRQFMVTDPAPAPPFVTATAHGAFVHTALMDAILIASRTQRGAAALIGLGIINIIPCDRADFLVMSKN
jgi:hypothetical protein